MDISIVIPNYNGEQIMKKNLPVVLEAVKEYKDGKVEIIIPDDPSTDTSAEVIEDFIKSIKQKHIIGKTISNKDKNKSGFSKNVNRGIMLATGDILILLNTDVIPHKNFLRPLLSHFNSPDVFAVGCMDESKEDNETVLRGRGIGKWIKGFLLHGPGALDKTSTLWVSGGSSAFSKKIWDKIGGLNELYNPFYWEDIDLSYRAQKAGYKVIFEKKSIVIHEHNTGAIKTLHKPFAVRKTAYRNQFFFVWLNITDANLIMSHLLWLPYHLLIATLHRDKAFLSGFLAAVVHLPQVLVKRKNTKKIFVTTDEEVLSRINF